MKGCRPQFPERDISDWDCRLDAPGGSAQFLIAAGVGVLRTSASCAARRMRPFRRPSQQSFQPLTGPLPKGRVARFKCASGGSTRSIATIQFLVGRPRWHDRRRSDATAARIRNDRLIKTIRRRRGYYGTFIIPLQFLAGAAVSTFPGLALFELQRAEQYCAKLADGDRSGSRRDGLENHDPVPAPLACARPGRVSYAAAPASRPQDGRAVPRLLDFEGSRHRQGHSLSQVDAIHARPSGRMLDEIHRERFPRTSSCTCFYAGPVSVGFVWAAASGPDHT